MSARNENDFVTTVERASDRELVLRRTFRARPSIVFDAMTKPEYLRRWWAPRSLGVVLYECDADVRVGGKYRYVFGKDGKPKMAFSGVYKEVVSGARLVYTQIFEPMPDTGDGIITATFEDAEPAASERREGTRYTLLTQRELYPSKEVLEGALASGMEKGMRETLDQLETFVAGVERETKNGKESEAHAQK